MEINTARAERLGGSEGASRERPASLRRAREGGQRRGQGRTGEGRIGKGRTGQDREKQDRAG